ncbi:hypothetical protein CFC21_043239 [Triticum aestivum]|uniref:Uncharacterized protein n=3 Tax=Triticum TaxID=4564 RepID=A0A9R1S714_TRITD|nr:uncharacterized protein LOC119281850 [Triticum dicoccoides]XP_044345161.1 uncharacterized protein LOC123066065 [Triticum aestivum]KAF7032008.1 hypothetical protein CFC21_043239 [Triticum aestivum]VAH82849.1 unnamed protein product [Triticum turgidum subsp. durum]
MDGDLTEGLLCKNSGKRPESPPPLSPSSGDIFKDPTDSSDSSTSGAATNRAPVRDDCKNHQEVVVASSAASEGEHGTVSTGEEEDKEASGPLARWEALAASAALREAAAAAAASRREAGRGFFFGGGRAGGGSSGGAVSSRAEHLILVPPPGAAGLIHRADHLSDSWRTDPILAGPSTDLTVALQAFAAAPDERTAARLEQAAAALDIVASSNTEDGAVAKQLAAEAAALAAGWRGDDRQRQGSSAFETAAGRREPELQAPASYSTETLLCAVISGSLALLPYLPTQVPKRSRSVFAVLFGSVFVLASVGVMLLVAHKRFANTLARISFGTFTVLVIAFVGFALGGRTYS